MNLSTKIVVALAPLFVVTVVLSIYFDYYFQEQQLLEQAQDAAHTQAEIIKSSLVNMMVTNQRIDDSYLMQINEVGNVENLSVLFHADSLKFLPQYENEERTTRLFAREQRVWEGKEHFKKEIYTKGKPVWFISCNLGAHQSYELDITTTRPFWLPSCERLSVVLPFKAEKKCQFCHEVPENKILGAAYMDVSLAKTAATLRTNMLTSIGIFLMFSSFALILGIIIYKKFIDKPVHHLVEATEVLGAGNLETPIPGTFDEDEFGKLADSFERMRQRLKEAQDSVIQKERLSTLGQMAGSIIHDFRSPMTVIGLSLDVLRLNSNLSPEKREELFSTIKETLKRMNKMTQELLEFSRGEMKLELHLYDVKEFTENIASLVEPNLKEKHIVFQRQVNCDCFCTFDKDRLSRAFLNIINNAEDAMPNGGNIQFQVSRANGHVLFEVKDSGSGIPEEIKEKLFQPFVTFGKKKGTGLGLAITKKIIEEHRGEVSVESLVGKGTTFKIKLPA